MLVSEAIKRIRYRINDEFDTGYLDDVIINYINDSIKYLSHALIIRNDPILLETITIADGENNKVPDNFVRFAGGYPIKKKGNLFYIADDSSKVEARYFFIPAEMSSEIDVLPFEGNDTYQTIIINLACIYALNQHEFNVDRDTALKQELEQIITQALGAVG